MDKPFKFRRARELSGVFVLFAIIVLAVGFVMHGQVEGWFDRKTVFEVMLPESGTQGIQVGSEVHILGSKVGAVTQVELRHEHSAEKLTDYGSVPADEIKLVAILEVVGDRAVFVGKNSRAVLKKDLAGFGSSYFELTRNGEPWSDDVEIRSLEFEQVKDVQNELTSIVKEIRDSLIPTLGQIEVAAKEIGVLANDLSREDGGLQGTLMSLDSVMEKINKGKGTIGAMISDEEAEKNFREMLANFNKASADLSNSLAKIDNVVTQMDEGKGTIGRLLRDEKTAVQLDETLENLGKASESLSSSLVKFDETAAEFPTVVNKWNSAIDGFGTAAKTMQEALKEYELLARGLQQHPLLKGSVNKARKGDQTGSSSGGRNPRPGQSSESTGKKRKVFPLFQKRKKEGASGG